MSRVSLKGVVVGGVVDIVATNLVALPVLVVAAAQANVAQLPKEEQGRAMLAAVNASPALFAVQLLLGSLCSVLGGYVAGRIAKRSEALNGALSAFLCVGFGVYALISRSDSIGPLGHAAFLVLSPVLGAAGGVLGARRNSRKAAAAPPAAAA